MAQTSDKPEGLTYRANFLTAAEEASIAGEIEALEFQEVRMHGVVARRTVVHFGWDYDYSGWKIMPAAPPPDWLASLRARAAEVAGKTPELFEQFLIARYPPGATIGWHRDAPMFGSPVLGISLLSYCRMRFRRDGYATWVQLLEPRSLYILDGAARSAWQHHIPPTKELRYSITMRTVIRQKAEGRRQK